MREFQLAEADNKEVLIWLATFITLNPLYPQIESWKIIEGTNTYKLTCKANSMPAFKYSLAVFYGDPLHAEMAFQTPFREMPLLMISPMHENQPWKMILQELN